MNPYVLASHVIVWIADPTPSPVPGFTGDEDTITPGVLGFVAIFVVALATVFLLLDMTRRVRRVRYRAEVQEQLAAEANESATPAPGDSSQR
jgi:hypothetical protein